MSVRFFTPIKPELIYCFGHLGAAETNCEHNIDISPFKVGKVNMSANSGLFILLQL